MVFMIADFLNLQGPNPSITQFVLSVVSFMQPMLKSPNIIISDYALKVCRCFPNLPLIFIADPFAL